MTQNQKFLGFLAFISLSILSFSLVAGAANVIVEFDAATAGAGMLPDGVSPPWQWVSNVPFGMEMTNDGTKLTQDWTSDDPTTSYENFVSPAAGGLMMIGSEGYGIEFRARPLSDMPTTDPNGNPIYSSHYANFMVAWSDDYYLYNVSMDLDTDDAGPGTTGALRTGQNRQLIVADNIDWTIPHTVFVGYYGRIGSQGIFKFYVDGALISTFTPAQIGGTVVANWQDRVMFGDSTTGQPAPYAIDVKGEWYFVRIYDSSSPSGTCGDPETNPYPMSDLDLSCFVDRNDLSLMIDNWLADNRPAAVEQSTVLAEYDASRAYDPDTQSYLLPHQLGTGWTAQGSIAANPPYIYNTGECILFNYSDLKKGSTNAGHYYRFLSPVFPSLMVNGNSQYGFTVRVRPLEDLSLVGSYEINNICVQWSDDVNLYMIGFDKDADDAGSGTLGRVVRKTSTMTTIFGGVDWSVPHTVGVAYSGDRDEFDFYLDGFFRATVSSTTLRAAAVLPSYIGRIVFGDCTTGGVSPDYNCEWYSARLYADTTTITQGVCGDIDHPYPIGDLNKDCLVDLDDIAGLAQEWLIDIRP